MKKRGTVCGGVCVLSNISSRDSSAQNWPGEGRGCLIGKGWVGEIDWQEEVEGGYMGLMSVQGRRGLDAASLPATSTADHLVTSYTHNLHFFHLGICLGSFTSGSKKHLSVNFQTI